MNYMCRHPDDIEMVFHSVDYWFRQFCLNLFSVQFILCIYSEIQCMLSFKYYFWSATTLFNLLLKMQETATLCLCVHICLKRDSF